MTNEEIKTLVQDSVKSAKISNQKAIKEKITELQNQDFKNGFEAIIGSLALMLESTYSIVTDVVTKSLIEYNDKTNK